MRLKTTSEAPNTRHQKIKTIAFIVALICAFVSPALGQAIRVDSQSYTTNASCVSGRQCPVLAVPGSTIQVCTPPGCSAPATTYTDASAGSACPALSPVTITGGANPTTCVATSDAQGNFGFWLLPGSYTYYVTVPSGTRYGPYPVSVHGDSGGYTLDSLYTTLALACSAAGNGTLAITKVWTGTPTQALTCNLLFFGGGQIQPATSATVTINGTVTATPFQQIFDTSLSGALIRFGTKSATLYPNWWGAVADGTNGTDGTDQAAKFQAAANAASASGGGTITVPYSPNCYTIGAAGWTLSSNTTVNGTARSTCIQKLHGNNAGPLILAGEGIVAAVSNIWIKNITLDGNKANITGIAGDGFNQGIAFAGASDSGTESVTVKNAYTGGISVACWGAAPATGAGNNVQLLNTIITASRRNNLEELCGTNTQMIGGQLSYATGGSLSDGADLEPFSAGQLTTGFSMIGVEVHHNRDNGISIAEKYDTNAQVSIINCSVHDNGTVGLGATNFNVGGPTSSGSLQVIGGSYINNTVGGDIAAIAVAGWAEVNISTTTGGNARGFLASANNGMVTLGPGFMSGTVYDVSVDGPNSVAALAGVTLDPAHTLIQPGEEGSIIQPLTGIPATFTGNGVVLWNSPLGTVNTAGTAVTWVSGSTFLIANFPNRQITINGVSYAIAIFNSTTSLTLATSAGTQTGVGYTASRSGQMAVASRITCVDVAANPECLVSDGTIATKIQSVTNVGAGFGGTQSNHPYVIGANNAATPGAQGTLTVNPSTGPQFGSSAFATIACSGPQSGTVARILDSTTATWGANIAGGGGNAVLAYCNGSNWTVLAK